MKITGFESSPQIMAELGNRLKDVRIACGLTQKQLAEKSGVSLRTIVNIESGKDATCSNILKTLRSLGLIQNVDLLVPDEEARPSDVYKLGKKRERAYSPRKGSSNIKEFSEHLHHHNSWTWGEDK